MGGKERPPNSKFYWIPGTEESGASYVGHCNPWTHHFRAFFSPSGKAVLSTTWPGAVLVALSRCRHWTPGATIDGKCSLSIGGLRFIDIYT